MSDTDLTTIYLVLLLVGAGQVVWMISVIAQNRFLSTEPMVLRQGRRAALGAFSIGLLWAAKYCVEKRWEPWPPDLLIIGGIDLYMAIAIASSALKHARS